MGDPASKGREHTACLPRRYKPSFQMEGTES